MDIGKRIKNRRKEKNLRQEDLAKKVNVSSQVISNWERGYTEPSQSDVAKLADALDCSTDFLHGRTDDPSNSNEEKLKKLPLEEGDSIHFFDMEGLDEDDIEFIKNQIEHLRKKAKKNDTDK
ncbi:transcriptional regulator with XRE-family HTH domain [Bacillus pakistanensis]|uniref:Transcriptional regulator with XRE-family HTH domain n=1 Tax=Rossellomorea pakistanensis TaxID=992288 RepID=A0ABS2ND76_9BACI|nr:helix-turn-helix domain-containing protein [Bacillus pakistanensis]MBM7585801.1 transcriptional regulator with XRE-family HTH domain [Bacillus pakistanensis]